MKVLFVVLLFLFSSFAKAQTYQSSSVITVEKSFQKNEISHAVIFTKESIAISKYLNGGTEDFALKIDKTEEKDYNSYSCKWYYCTSIKKDAISGFTKAIVIVPSSGKSVYLFDFADEVTIFSSQFLID